MVPADEVIWIAAARQGDGEAMAALYDRHYQAVLSHCMRTVSDWEIAQEVAQDTFVKAFLALHRTNEALQFRAWVYRIATNGCLDVLRRKQRLRWQPWDATKHDHLLTSAPTDDPERQIASHESRLLVRRVLDAMTERHRTALILREFDGLSCYEIGEVMGLSRSAVKSLLFRARHEFRTVCLSIERNEVMGREVA